MTNPVDGPAGMDEERVRLQRRYFVRAVARDAIGAAAVLVGTSDAVRSIALRAVVAARPVSEPVIIEPVPIAVSADPGDLPGVRAYRVDATGLVSITDRSALPWTVRDQPCANGSELARALARHAVGSGPVLGELAAYALAGTASSIAHMDPAARHHVLRATSAIIGATRPASGALADGLRRAMTTWAPDAPDPTTDALRALGDHLAVELDGTLVAIARHVAHLIAPTIGGLLLHGSLSRLATGRRSAAGAVMEAIATDGQVRAAWVSEVRPSGEGATATQPDLTAHGVRSTLIADAATGALLASGRVGAVITMAEHVGHDGVVIAPIGTYTLAVVAAVQRIPFIVLAPAALVGPATRLPAQGAPALPDGRRGSLAAQLPDAAPLMDATPAELITAVVTEAGSA